MLPLLLSLALAGPPSDDVLVILLDDVGKELLDVYSGPDAAHTPNIDLLAAQGRVYDRAYANPLCASSRACMMTGKYGFRTGIGTTPGPFAPYVMPSSEECIPEFLLPGGATSFQFYCKWHLVHSDGDEDTDRHPFDACGFDRFFGHLGNIGAETSLPGTDHYFWRAVEMTADGPEVSILNGYIAQNFSEVFWSTSICKDRLVFNINTLDPAERAVFVWAPVAPHAPFQAPPVTLVSPATAASIGPPPAVAAEGEERLYALAMMEALDNVIGEALAEISPARMAQLTVVLIGDNGTSRKVIHPSFDPDRAKGSLYEPGIGVPLIVKGPSVMSPGTRDDSLVHIVDVSATIAGVLGTPFVGGGDSVSFYPTFASNQPGTRTSVFSERFDPNGLAPTAAIRAIVGERYKLICSEEGVNVTEELYDLDLDPDETNDLMTGTLSAAERVAYRELKLELRQLLGRADTFCDGIDGSLASCPCANPGNADSGCEIQQGTGGVRLSTVAQQTTPLNRATMTASGFPPATAPAAIVIRSAALDAASPVVFGDGLRCIGVPLVRTAATFAASGTSTHTFGHGTMAGAGTAFYQVWFRNTPVMYCDPSAAFNLSGGRVLVW